MSLYKEILLDHFKNPRHYDRGQLINPDFTVTQANPLCGDSITIKGLVINGILEQAVFTGHGCVISQAASSILLEQYTGRLVSDILNLTHADMINLVGIELGPNRLKCALIGLLALQKGLGL